jgi:hypothetical protein
MRAAAPIFPPTSNRQQTFQVKLAGLVPRPPNLTSIANLVRFYKGKLAEHDVSQDSRPAWVQRQPVPSATLPPRVWRVGVGLQLPPAPVVSVRIFRLPTLKVPPPRLILRLSGRTQPA